MTTRVMSRYETSDHRTCHICGEPYQPGAYAKHIRAGGPDGPHSQAIMRRNRRPPRARTPLQLAYATRDADVIAALVGPPRRTLEGVGAMFGITRERVRQIAKHSGVNVADLKPLPPKPKAPPRLLTCKVCGEPFRRGTYVEHIIATGHVRNLQPVRDGPDRGREALALVEQGTTWTETARRTGIGPRRLASVLRRGGHRGYGWHPRNIDRNLEIARRYFVAHETAQTIVDAMGLAGRSTVFNVTGAVRAVGGMENLDRLMPQARGGAYRRSTKENRHV